MSEKTLDAEWWDALDDYILSTRFLLGQRASRARLLSATRALIAEGMQHIYADDYSANDAQNKFQEIAASLLPDRDSGDET